MSAHTVRIFTGVRAGLARALDYERKSWGGEHDSMIRIGRLKLRASRWPWQGYGWFPHKNGRGPKAMLNASGARFGAGWRYKLGIDVGGSSVLLNLIFGMVMISLEDRK